jgi:hypothetical protein
LNNGRKGIGKRAQSQRPLTTHNNFHLFLALSFNSDAKEVMFCDTLFNSDKIDVNSHSLTWLPAINASFDASHTVSLELGFAFESFDCLQHTRFSFLTSADSP